ncbi:protein SCO1/2 [endosymbiont of Ridgeia piscesae]|jgi:protein SCO1/2|uniref:Protein SCO1/2 n=2 Tax=endosymbiont of Ridgeia piscesae TaxID=54398 RepID=A0A0T5ZC02_9GAMM|nr:protein SCO1/2 [endosymbiont of Ridgeia piscesae]
MGFRPSFLPQLLMAFCLLFNSAAALSESSFRVIATIKPIHSLLAALMNGADSPELLISGEQSPYGFELSKAQAERLRQADILVWVGPELEASLAKTIQALPSDVRVIELLSSDVLKILPMRADHSQRDPFFWLDDRNAILLVEEFARLLSEADPKRSHIYAKNRRKLQKELARIDREYEYGYRGLKAGLGLQYYDTLQYFEQAYALTVLEHVAASPRHNTDAHALLKVRQRIADGEAVCLLTEAGMQAEHLALLTEGQTINVGQLDSLGIHLEPGPDLYVRMMDHNTDTIKRCLNADVAEAARARDVAKSEEAPAAVHIGGRFILTDHLGRLFTQEDFLGSYSLLYFGYTYCPDVCPTSLQVLSLALDMLGDRADGIKPYFITIDPERDTVKVMRNYVEYFNPRLVGLTGSKEMIERVAQEFKVKYEKVTEDAPSPELYLMDHSASLYLMGPDGRFITKFAHGITPKDLVKELALILP